MNENFIETDLAAVFQAVSILSTDIFQFAGELPIQASALPSYIPNHPLPENPLVRALETTLYNRCYAHRIHEWPPSSPEADPQFPLRLSAANRGRDRWDAGWKIYQTGSNGQIYISKGERQRAALPGEYITNAAPGAPPQIGNYATLIVPHESHAVQPSFYFLFSETPTDVWDEHDLIRFYFHSTPQMVESLIEQLTLELNRYSIPYRMKTLNDSALYTRTDATVLYCAKRYFDVVYRLLLFLPEEIRLQLMPSVPLFAKPLLPGVGLAEDPRTGESFGMHRCRLVSEGIVDAWLLGQQSIAARFRAVKTRFAMNGMHLEKPYLNPGSIDRFTMPLREEDSDDQFELSYLSR